MDSLHVIVTCPPAGAEVQPGGRQRRETFPVAGSAALALQPCHASRLTQTGQQTQ